MASNPIRIRWIGTCSQPNWKIMYRIVLQLILARILSTLRMLQATFKALSRQTNQPKKMREQNLLFYYWSCVAPPWWHPGSSARGPPSPASHTSSPSCGGTGPGWTGLQEPYLNKNNKLLQSCECVRGCMSAAQHVAHPLVFGPTTHHN